MPVHHIKAIPTEYKNTVYRSKTEAVFAAAWDDYYAFQDGPVLISGLYYEPESYRVGDWVPDFVAYRFSSVSTSFGASDWFMVGHVIELKPAEITESYSRLMASRFENLHRFHNCRRDKIIDHEFYIYQVNPFESDDVIVHIFHPDVARFRPANNFTLPFDHVRKSVRFDLKSK